MRAMKLTAPQWLFILLGVVGAARVGATWPLLALVFSEIIEVLANPESDGAAVRKWSLVFVAVGAGSWVVHFMQLGFLGMAGQN